MVKVNFLKVGCADCTVIHSNNQTHIIDCNNKISDYKGLLPTNKKIRAVFITHQHYDHFEGLHYLYDNNYSIEYLFQSPYERRYSDNSVKNEEWNDCSSIISKFESKGTKIYKPFRQEDFTEPYWKVDDFSYYIIGPVKSIAQSDTRELHDASLVITLVANKKCCFAGDASDASLNWIANNTNNFCDNYLHASHHGSLNGADLEFIKKCNTEYTIISTESGAHESVPHPTALERYRANSKIAVHRTDTNGSLQVEI